MAKCPRTSPAPDSSSSSSPLPTQQQSAVASTCGEVAKMGCSPPVAAVWCDFAVEEGDLRSLAAATATTSADPAPDNAAGNDATPHYSALHSTLYPSFCMFRMYTLRRVAENREEHRSRVTIDSTAREPACPASPRSACRSCLRQPAIGRSGWYPPRARLWRSAIINACFPFDMKGPPET